MSYKIHIDPRIFEQIKELPKDSAILELRALIELAECGFVNNRVKEKATKMLEEIENDGN